MRSPADSTFRRWVRRCRVLYPVHTGTSVRVRRSDGPVDHEHDAATYQMSQHDYMIVIWRGMCRQATLDTLLHEWTHVLRWEEDPDHTGDHDDTFWILFGGLYRAWHRTT